MTTSNETETKPTLSTEDQLRMAAKLAEQLKDCWEPLCGIAEGEIHVRSDLFTNACKLFGATEVTSSLGESKTHITAMAGNLRIIAVM